MSEKKNINLKYFGTDGFRGEYKRELTDTHAEAIGRFLGTYFGEGADILIGRDTRKSSKPLEAAMVKGIRSTGGTAYLLSVCPTPAVSYLTKLGGINAAVMITASHNPAGDNGIKLFGSDGEKLPDEIVADCEKFIDENIYTDEKEESPVDADTNGNGRGFIKTNANRKDRGFVNVQHLMMRWENELKQISTPLCGLKIGLDCANGATYSAAPIIFKALGAEVFTIGCKPDGENINLGVGSTHPEALSMMVQEEGLDMGFAFDGDGDRCIAIDKDGRIIDGDSEMFILAKVMKARGELCGDAVVCTVMSNGGFIRSLEKTGIKCHITPVGDRFVAEKMKELGASLGGEQSGHLIFNEGGGDGIRTALCLASEAVKSGMSLGELSHGLKIYPQATKSIRVADKSAIMNDSLVLETVQKTAEEIGDIGRILLRPSGTENLIRLMVEHENPDKCKQYITNIAKLIEDRSEINKSES